MRRSEENQVVHGLPAGGLVVDADVRIVGALAAGGQDADPHQLQALLLGLRYRKREYYDRVDLAPGRKPLEESLPVRSVTDVVQEHIEVGLAQYRLERLEHGGEEPPGDVRYHDRNPPSRAAGQAGRFGRDHVGQFLGHGEHPFPGGGGNTGSIAQRPRRRCQRHARHAGDIDHVDLLRH